MHQVFLINGFDMMKQKNILQRIVPLLVLLIILAAPPVDARDIAAYTEEADAHLNQGQYLEAIDAYQNIVEQENAVDELRAKAAVRIADIYSHFLSNYDKALEQYTMVQNRYAHTPHVANTYFNAGMALYERNRYGEAREQFRTYIEKYPEGNRKDAAIFMLETCSQDPPTKEVHTHRATLPKDKIIRVLIAEGIPQVRIDSPLPLKFGNNGVNYAATETKTVIVGTRNGHMTLNDSRIAGEEISISSSSDNRISVNGRPYRGHIRIRKGSRTGLDVVNMLPLESYLYGTVPKEMSPQWLPEALKAQAVAARTYALYQMSKSGSRHFDVYGTTASQVYGGAAAETERTNRAVDDTQGLILLHDGQLVLAYFHANSGGMTEDAARVWSAEIPYLKAVRDDFSLQAPGCVWKRTFNLQEIREALKRSGVEIGPIEKITVDRISPTGRVMKFRLIQEGEDVILNGNEFRLKISPTLIKSTYVTLSQHSREISFEGKGYGHGVGMSQWGAYMMAKEGRSFRDILLHYYRGVEIGTL